ncbi:unnamed protein product [Rhizophagus irregularis]|nr:unnamed protein product [Rhizophagus irregularis]
MIIRSHLQATDTDIFIPLPFQQFFEYGISVRFSGSPCGCLRLFFFRFQRFFSHLGFDDPLWKCKFQTTLWNSRFGRNPSGLSDDRRKFGGKTNFSLISLGSSAFWTWDFGRLDTRVWTRNTEKSALTLVPQFQTLIAVTSSLSPLTSLSEFSV